MFTVIVLSPLRLCDVLQALLKEHANDNPNLSYNGKPIVKWPKRVSTFKVGCFLRAKH